MRQVGEAVSRGYGEITGESVNIQSYGNRRDVL
jgi:hypothetical protein